MPNQQPMTELEFLMAIEQLGGKGDVEFLMGPSPGWSERWLCASHYYEHELRRFVLDRHVLDVRRIYNWPCHEK